MIEALLIHKVEVYRRATESANPAVQKRDRFRQPLAQNPRQHPIGGETLIAIYPARAWQPSGGLKMEERTTDTFEREWKVYTSVGVDIREDDSVRCLDGNGRVIFGLSKVKNSEVKYDRLGPHHCEFVAWEQSGPDSVS